MLEADRIRGAAVVLLIGVLLPGAYSLLAGYQIQALKQEADAAGDEQASLEIQASAAAYAGAHGATGEGAAFSSIRRRRRWFIWIRKSGSVAMNQASSVQAQLPCAKLNPPAGCTVCSGSCSGGRGSVRAAGLAAGDPSRRSAEAGAAAAAEGSRDSGAARDHSRPHRPAAGEEHAGRIGVRESAEDSGYRDGGGSALADVWIWIARSCTTRSQTAQLRRQRIPVDQAQESRRTKRSACAV